MVNMKRTIVLATILMVIMASITIITVLADPTDYDKKADLGIYYLVAKDPNTWEPLPRETNPFGMGKFSIEGGTLTMRLVAHKLTPGNWYFVELVDKEPGGTGWIPLNPQDVQGNVLVQFYGQADEDGDVKITFTWSIVGHDYVEIDMKNADWVPRWDKAALGNPAQWIYTGQGWSYVLYGATTIPSH